MSVTQGWNKEVLGRVTKLLTNELTEIVQSEVDNFLRSKVQHPGNPHKSLTHLFRFRYTYVMHSVSEFAKVKDLSPQRVRVLAESGAIPARRVGGRWIIDDAAMSWEPRASRPLSKRSAWLLIHALNHCGQVLPGILPAEKSRLLRHLEVLRRSDSPAAMLRSWLSSRASVYDVVASSEALRHMHGDKRLVLSGISDERSFMAANAQLEAYVNEKDLDAVRNHYFLVPGERNNVRLHVVSGEPDVGIGLVAADLSDWSGPREDAQAARLITEALK